MRSNGRPIFGVLIGLVNTGYYRNILSGIMDFVREKDCSLQCFATGLMSSPSRWDADDDLLFSLLERARLDGLILITTALEYFISRDAFPGFLSRFPPMCFASIGNELPGVPSFVIDNEKGMSDMLAHLTDHHGCRRPAYLSGPLRNTEAAIRYKTYRTFLQSRGLDCDPEFVIEGDFTGRSGKLAVQTLLEERAVRPDVIIAANDMMAFGAIEELRGRGIPVPGGMRVVGFDDIDTSGDAQLTTVRQPLYRQGYEAAAALFRQLHGERVPALTRMPTAAVIRGSCGCPSQAFAACSLPASSIGPSPAKNDTECFFSADVALPPPRVRRLYAALRRSLAECNPEFFLSDWRDAIFRESEKGIRAAALQYLISLLRRDVLSRSCSEEEAGLAERLFHQARILIEEEVRREITAQRIGAEIRELHWSFIDAGLSGASGLEEQLRVVYSEFPALGIRSCYLSLFDDIRPGQERARLILAYEDMKRIDLPDRGVVFPAVELIPAALFPDHRRHNFLMKILSHRGANLGFILMEMGDDLRSAETLDLLCPKLSNMLQLAIFIEKTVAQARELDRANARLAENNRVLEEFAVMASHDLQEPIRKILLFGDRLESCAGFTPEAERERRDYLERMRQSANRLKNMIKNLLEYSRIANTDSPFVPVDLGRIAADVTAELAPSIMRTGAEVMIDPLPVVTADPALMRRLFYNLIENALKFQPPGARPRVDISVLSTAEEGMTAVAVTDNGIGIDAKDHEKIFAVFTRLHARREYEGNGIGLAICKRIMERHGGAVTVENAEGCGTRFILWFHPQPPPADVPGA